MVTLAADGGSNNVLTARKAPAAPGYHRYGAFLFFLLYPEMISSFSSESESYTWDLPIFFPSLVAFD